MSIEPDTSQIKLFQETVWEYYAKQGRDMPWRHVESDGSYDPYKILVSELMLQQTQARRVIPKFEQFLSEFPTVQYLAATPLSAVLTVWSGLGYNRRAKFLWQIASVIVKDYQGVFPSTQKELSMLPGIGSNTAGAICAYAFNQPVIFIETNIRTVFIHHFYQSEITVSDKDLLPLVAATCDQEHPREWYWALMDYGTHLKATVGNVSRASKHYVKQSAFKGSKRQIRGQIIQQLIKGPHKKSELIEILSDERTPAIIEELLQEELIKSTSGTLHL